MAGVKSHWNQVVADDPLNSAQKAGPGRITTTSSAGDAAGGPIRSGPLYDGSMTTGQKRREVARQADDLSGRSTGRWDRGSLEDQRKRSNEIQQVNRRR